MTLPENIAIYECLSEGIKDRAVFDDPKMLPKTMLTKLATDFDNDDYVIAFLSNASFIKCWDSMDPNDHSRIRIHRACKSYCIVILLLLTYTTNLLLLSS